MIAAETQPGDDGGCLAPATPRTRSQPDTTTALDHTHLEALEARRQIRAMFADARTRVARWEPTPCPEST